MIWAPIPGWQGYYEASDEGQIRSVDGIRNGRKFKGRILKPGHTPKGYQTVVFTRDGGRFAYTIHRLVAETFLGPMPEGMHTMHMDDDKTNNAVANLRYGTPSENELDKVRHGRNPNANKTHCPRGHEYTPENTMRDGKRGRRCKTCHRNKKRAYDQRKRSA